MWQRPILCVYEFLTKLTNFINIRHFSGNDGIKRHRQKSRHAIRVILRILEGQQVVKTACRLLLASAQCRKLRFVTRILHCECKQNGCGNKIA